MFTLGAMCAAQDRISGVQMYVLAVSVATVGLWCANGALADVFGEMGIIAVLPMVALFGFGVLGKARLLPSTPFLHMDS